MTEEKGNKMHTLQPVITSKVFKVGNNRGKKRVWMEGNFLKNAGIVRGMKFSKRILTEGFQPMMVLDFDDQGPHTVAGTEQRPIIDMNGKYLADVLDDFANYSASIHKFESISGISYSIIIGGTK